MTLSRGLNKTKTIMKFIKLYEEFVNEAIDTKYWADYNKDTSGQGDKKFADKSKNFDDTFDYAVEDWNNEADGPENKIKGAAIGKIQKLAKEFFKKHYKNPSRNVHRYIMFL